MKISIYLFYSADFQALKNWELNHIKGKNRKQEAVSWFLFKTTNPFKSNLSEKEIKLAGNLSESKKQEGEEEETGGRNQTREQAEHKKSISKL